MPTLYARSDLALVAIPRESGGCGEQHARPVISGAPVKTWQLSCPACTRHLIKDPLWSSNPVNIPLTPDEEQVAEQMKNESARQRAQHDALIAYETAEKTRAQLDSQRTLEEAAQERTRMEQQFAAMAAELDRLRQLVSAGNGAGGHVTHSPVTSKATQVTTKAEATAASTPASKTCAACGGPLRAPGQKGPTPKGTCLACRRKAA